MTMSYINLDTLTELDWDLVRRLRFSKSLDTLDRQCERLEIRHANNYKMLNAINTAWCVREKELLEQGAPTFKGGKTRLTGMRA